MDIGDPQPLSLAYESTREQAPYARMRRFFSLLAICISVGSIVVFIADVFTPRDSGDRGYQIKSASNLRWIGQGILMYQNENHGSYPDDFVALILANDIEADAFVDPRTKDTPARGATTKAIANALLSGGHCSYEYVGTGFNQATLPAEAVVAFEKRSSSKAGGNVLFGDGHVDYLGPQWWLAYSAKVATRPSQQHLPVTMP